VPRGSALAAILAVAAAASTAEASPLDLFGFGGRSPGLAGAGGATTDDYDAVFLNPAGLAEARRKRATVGYLYGDFALTLDRRPTGTDPASGLILGGVVPVPLGGRLRDRIGLGLGLYVPSKTLNRVRHPFPGVPVYALLESRSHVIAIQVAVGARVAPAWSVGAGVITLAELDGHIDVTTDAAGRFTTFSEQRLVTHFAPVVGARWRRARVAAALTLRAPARSDYDIEVNADLGDSIPVALPPVRIAGTAQYDPLTVAAEATYRAAPDLSVTGQLAYQRWSAYPLPTQNPVRATPPQELPGFHDTAVPRLAAEWTRDAGPLRVAARTGYAFLWSPAPEMRGRQSLLDNDRHLFALGAGVATTGAAAITVDVWLQCHLLAPRRHVKDAGRFGPDDPPPFDVIDTGGRILVGGLTVGVDL